MIGAALLIFFIVLILARVPIGWALAASSMLVIAIFTDTPLSVGAQRITAGITPFPLLAIPLFIMAGSLMNAGGMTSRLIDLAEAAVGRIRGGLAQTNVLTSMLFGGLSGSAVADVSSLGKILIPSMKERNYRAAYAAVVTAATSVVAPVLPPSITLIVYGVVSGTSISDLFVAGIIPAVLYVVTMMLVVHLTVNRQGFEPVVASPSAEASVSTLASMGARNRSQGSAGTVATAEGPGTVPARKPFFRVFLSALPGLGMPVLILVGIRGGIFTPTEAAAIAVVYAILVGSLIYRELSIATMLDALRGSSKTVGLIMVVLASAQLYSWALSIGNVPRTVTSSLSGLTENPLAMLLMVNLLLLLVGMFIEANAAIIIMTPLLLPLATAAGIDPVHLGIVIVINMGIGLITPPVGVCLMLASDIAEVRYSETIRAVLPFLGAGLVLLVLITYVPQISLFLPNVLGN